MKASQKKQFWFLVLFVTTFFTVSAQSESSNNSKTDKTNNKEWETWENTSKHDTIRLLALEKFIGDEIQLKKPDSIAYYSQILFNYAKAKNIKKWMGIALIIDAQLYESKFEFNKCDSVVTEALELFKEIDYYKGIGRCYYMQSKIASKDIDGEEGLILANKAKELQLKYGYEVDAAVTTLYIGDLYPIGSKEAVKHIKEAISYFEKGGDKHRAARASVDLGVQFCKKGDFKTALPLFFQSLKISEEVKDIAMNGATVNLIGMVYGELNDYENATRYYTKAEKIFSKLGQRQRQTMLLQNLAGLELKKGNPETALEFFLKALALGKQIDYFRVFGVLHGNVGTTYAELKEFKKAKEHFDLGLEYSLKYKHGVGIVANYNNLALHEQREKNYRQAFLYAKEAVRHSQKNEDTSGEQKAQGILSNISTNLGDYKTAFEAYETSIILRDSIESQINRKEIYNQEAKYEYEKQALADSLTFIQKQLITQATVENQRLGLIAAISALLFLIALAYSIFKSRQRAQAEADRVKELDAFKSKFYTNITHEFRTPLTVILGMINQIEENPKKNLKEGVELIKRNGKNLLNQINQILDLSKLETKSFQLTPIKDDLIAFVRYTSESFQSYANGRNLSLRFFTPLESFVTNFDPDAIQKIMQNLISNALKYTPSDGEVKVYLAQNGNDIEIKVKDTGVGIAEAELPHIFDRFYQVENPSEKTQEGTGIGLAYVQELVRVMKGKISVKSVVGEGTEFLVVLPLIKNEKLRIKNDGDLIKNEKLRMKNEPTSQNRIIPQTFIEKPGEEEHSSFLILNSSLPQLLIIEDNPDVVAYLKNCLADQYQIDIAYNGRIGIEKAFANIPDLIITDVMMPEVGGYEVCDTLKNDERTSHIPIIMLTAKADMASKIAGLKRGADVYLSKPFDKEELLIRMEMMVERQKKLATYFSNSLQNGVTGNNEMNTENIEAEVIQMEDVFIQKVKTILEKNYSDEGFGLPQLCSKIGMSRSQLFRKMKALIGESPSGFIRDYRLNKAKELLEKGEMNVSEVAWETGFTNLAHFSKVFQDKFGIQPSATSK